MNRSEFLEKLQNALENDLHGQFVQENIDYYNNYIIEEVRKGRSEESVIEELGDPWMIARTLIEAAENKDSDQGKSSYEAEHRREGARDGQTRGSKVYGFSGQSWWKTLVVILGIIGVLVLIVAVIGGLFALVAPFIFPLLVIVFVFRLLGRGRR